jgi:hypothetical protein
MNEVGSALRAWENFYVITGSSAGALIGLQFVVVTLVAESRMRSTGNELGAFATPTILHFSAVLLIAAIVSAPWPTLGLVAVALGLTGIAGLAYSVNVVVQARKQRNYQMVLEDWIFHTFLPFVAYGALTGGSVLLQPHPARALFTIAGAALLLLFVGIHNAWDTTTFVILDRMRREDRVDRQ